MPTNLSIDQAVTKLRAGKLVIFPTETVYGLGADAQNPQAVADVFALKGRPASNPLIIHIESTEQLVDWAIDIPALAYDLAAEHWPGPLTLILKRAPHVSDAVTAGQPTVALRIPNHPVALHLLRSFGGGLVAPSANQFTRLSPTTATAAAAAFPEHEILVLDGGACAVGIESTILDLSTDVPRILRPGMLTAFDLNLTTSDAMANAPRVPGQHHLHYAPRLPARLVESADVESALAAAREPIGLLSLTSHSTSHLQISMPDDPIHYAQVLYANLSKLELAPIAEIWIEAVPEHPSWNGIRDRIDKACGSRQQ